MGPKKTSLHAYELTAAEETALASLRARALKPGAFAKAWCAEAAFLPLTNAAYRSAAGVIIELAAALEDIETALSRALRPERQLVKVLRLSDGKMQEIDTYRTSSKTGRDLPAAPATEKEEEVEKKEEEILAPDSAVIAEAAKAKAVTVARPVNGCPMPDFPAADVRASRVLETFLTGEQIRDYRKEGAFVTRGADTGRRYLICNRESPEVMRLRMVGRQLYDLDLRQPICVHDWAVPPPEEMLALHLCLSLPGRESELLTLPEIDPRLAHLDTDPYRNRG